MTWHVRLDNIAGIRHAEADIEPGVNAVRASNWQGKSSFLGGLKTALGTATPLTEGTSTGRAVLDTGDAEYAVELSRNEGGVSRTGDPYLRDEYDRVCAELFAFLDEGNEIRQAVRDGANLQALLTRPLDFENIDAEIADRRHEREQVSSELEAARDAADRLPALQERVTSLEAELADLRERRDAVDADSDGDGSRREDLADARAQRDRADTRVDRLESTAERFRETLADKRTELADLTVPSTEALEDELDDLHEELRTLERDRELLQSVYESNKRILDEGRAELLTDVSRDVLDDNLSCWLCGSDTSRGEVESRLDALDDRIRELRSEATERSERVEQLEAERDAAREARTRKRDLTDRIAELESRLTDTESDLDAARAERDRLDRRIDDLEADIDAAEDDLTSLESDIKYTEAELADARETLETVERRAEQRPVLEEEYDSLTEEIRELRNRKDRIARRTREAFSTALAEILDRFETGFETARLTGEFELVVAREGREARLDALSEGERELLGIFAALAGHEAFDVAERVPVLLLDRLGGLASDNLRILVAYLAERVDYLVLTAYPEHDGFDGHELSPAEWDVVSHSPAQEAP